MKCELIEYPSDNDWLEVKRRALVTKLKLTVQDEDAMASKHPKPKNVPTVEWKHRILEARHSPIRRLHYSFLFEDIPSWVSVHFCRHVHAQPYVGSQRNDRQGEYDRNAARQDVPIDMILDVNAEELMVMANKRLCNTAAKETRDVMWQMCQLVLDVAPEFEGLLVPMCEYHGDTCHEMFPCGRFSWKQQHDER